MRDRQRAPRQRLLLLMLLLFSYVQEIQSNDVKKFGDKCTSTDECGFEGAICDELAGACLCRPEFPVTNHLDKCGVAAKVNESCFFNEQCEKEYILLECRDGVCICRFQRQAVIKPDGTIDCIPMANSDPNPPRFIDPAMIGILVAMFLMFITICVVLRLFSKARWGENRTIFNTPNPRLMNASLLRENKGHHDRRGSKISHAPSRPESVTSLQPHSPNSQVGSRRGSKGSNVSAPGKIIKSPSKGATTPMLESVAVDKP
ncbi:uncharacterized protein LOC126744973 [Anthonomus grandis grandis]|uniref:uncharacterized protein LOC126744973 n=1 Tax=Anthonomus grandis grandis TaxID=2921223 RepID=UPI0021660306|nr:uncharacterized protein LOC126744973 [Anthonomus grandis grandis]